MDSIGREAEIVIPYILVQGAIRNLIHLIDWPEQSAIFQKPVPPYKAELRPAISSHVYYGSMRMKKVTAFFILALFSYSSFAGLFGYDNYAKCEIGKKAEYIDKGANAHDAWSRASAYCETKFPLLEPKYVHDRTVSGKWGKLPEKNRYEILLNKDCAYISFEARLENGEVQKFTKIETRNSLFQRNTVAFQTNGPVISVTILEALVNVNVGKHVGDD